MNCKHCGAAIYETNPGVWQHKSNSYLRCLAETMAEPEEQQMPGEGYRLLDLKVDNPQVGDEFLLHDGRWVPAAGWNVAYGIFNQDFVYRRKIQPEEQPEQDTVDATVYECLGELWVTIPGKWSIRLSDCWAHPRVCGPVVDGVLRPNTPGNYVWFLDKYGEESLEWESGFVFKHCDAVRFVKE